MGNITATDILEGLLPGIDLENETALVDHGVIDSLSMIALVAELEDVFDITIPAIEVMAENFNTVAAIEALVDRLAEKQHGE